MIIQQFEEQLSKFSKNIAVVDEHSHLTYEQLNRLANRAAHTITNHISNKKQGSTPVVGLLFQHSNAMVAAVLAALKAGCAYLPLDFSYPENRLAYMLEDAGAVMIVTNRQNWSLASRLVSVMDKELPLIDMDEFQQESANDRENDSQNPARTPSPDRLAYILYTSGSTGKPKGVMQTHENVCYYVRNWIERFNITPADRMTFFTAFSHDGAGQDIFGALHAGAALYPYNILTRPNIGNIIQWLNDEQITIWHSVPTIYRYFINTLEEKAIQKGNFDKLRAILLGGEQVRSHDIRMFNKYFPSAIFANVYGQTESSVNTVWLIHAGEAVNKMLIGDPFDRTRILIVDEDGDIIEDLGIGEIFVACKHISPGYWNNEAAAKGRFIDDPDLGRLYRTGDLGRLMTDGTIEFMGRKDAQVKIRGFRIETGEIETRLLSHNAIKEAVTVVKADDHQNDHLCAYYVAYPGSTELTVSQMREFLSAEIPEYMIPSYFIPLDTMPLTPNGKIDRKQLPDPDPIRPNLDVRFVAPETEIEKTISTVWKELLNLDKVGVNDNFFDLGGTSFDIIKMMSKLYDRFKREIPVVSVFQYPTIRTFVDYLKREQSTDSSISGTSLPESSAKDLAVSNASSRSSDIAVIGMACRFPGARTIQQFWENLVNGKETISFFTSQELINESMADPQVIDRPNFVKARGIIDKIEYFDALFFNYSPNEARVMEPQLRIMHEVCWEALETAGYDPDRYEGDIGLYAGNSVEHYWTTLVYLNNVSQIDSGFLTNNYSTIVSYKLNLKGPSITMKTACSTSLVSIHLGCRGLLEGECDMALAGGVSVWLPEKNGYVYQEGMIYSRDGHVYPFDARANGTVFGNGAGMVLLKRLDDARADNDTIYAVIKASGINNDGRRKIGLASPSVEGQAQLIRRVIKDSGLSPETITYVEAHGTGTSLGDPVEVEALKLAYATDKRGYCKIGSVKSNVGHLNIAAGVSGFIKTALSLYHRRIPPSINFEVPNPKIDFEHSPFVVNAELCDWDQWRGDLPVLRAAVSAFGIGGTNAHIILQEPPELPPSSPARRLNMLLLSAATKTALEQASANLARYLKDNPETNLSDIAYTLHVGRKAGKLRKMLLCSNTDEAVNYLEHPPVPLTPETGKIYTTVLEEEEQPVIFMFPGQGAQYVNMGLGLYQKEPTFRDAMDRCFKVLENLSPHDFKHILYPSPKQPNEHSGGVPAADTGQSAVESKEENQSTDIDIIDIDINQTEITQPMLFVFEYAMARLLMRWGFTPYAMIGHSIGEYTAACLSGVFSLEEALRLVVLRGRLMQQLPTGSMLSVALPEHLLSPLLTSHLSLATVNTTSACVVSGNHEAIDSFEKELKDRGYDCRRLHTSHAFHSAMMDPILEEFRAAVVDVQPKAPVSPYISNVSGNWITVEEATDPSYWVKHLRETVWFEKGLAELLKEKGAVFLEVGPGRTLSTFIRQHDAKRNDHLSASLVRHPRETTDDEYFLLSRIGRLWLEGKRIQWRGFYSGQTRRRIPLPTYPFQGQRFYLEGNPTKLGMAETQDESDQSRLPLEDWFYVPAWQTSVTPLVAPGKIKPRIPVSDSPLQWLILNHQDDPMAGYLTGQLTELKQSIGQVLPADEYASSSPGNYCIDPADESQYRTLLEAVMEDGGLPEHIIHMWNLDTMKDGESSLVYAFYSLLYLARSIAALDPHHETRITVLTRHMQPVTGADIANPFAAAAMGAVQVIPLEFPLIDCRAIDIDDGEPELLAAMVLDRLFKKEDSQRQVAFRNNQLWKKAYEPYPMGPPSEAAPKLKQNGVYLVTGGLGGIGLVLAQFLAQTLNARLILTARTPLPPKEEWLQYLESSDSDPRIVQKIRDVMELESAGGEVIVCAADAADLTQMKDVVTEAHQRFGSIHGVIHSAGVADGGLIQVRSDDLSQRVFEAKINGTLVLDQCLKEEPLDFFLLCSSVSAVTGTIGQVAYSAANAFMDHFAYYKTARDSVCTISVNWDAWSEVGMAVEAVKKLSGQAMHSAPATPSASSTYPFFKDREAIDANHIILTAFMDPGACWFLDEHRIAGKATMPGTGYLELARAALTRESGANAVELRDILFMAPLMVEDEKKKEVRIILKKNNDDIAFSIISRFKDNDDGWLEHCRGTGRALTAQEAQPVSHNIGEIEKRCSDLEITMDTDTLVTQNPGILFGPRWDCLRSARYGKDEVIGKLQLNPDYQADINEFQLHPALLDVGNVLLKRRMKRDIRYIPAIYNRLKFKTPLSSTAYFHVRNAERNTYGDNVLKYDILIMDENGLEVTSIHGFSLRRIHEHVVEKNIHGDSGKGETYQPELHPLSYFIPDSYSPQSQFLSNAISPKEGVEAFRRVLTGEAGPQVAVVTTSLTHRIKRARGLIAAKKRNKKGADDTQSTPKAARPELTTDYVAPENDVETRLAKIYQELLGIDQVGVYDDFFELGGDSLKAVNFGSRIQKELNTEVPITEFFNRPNIKMLSEFIRTPGDENEYSGIPSVEEREYYPLSSAQERLFILNRVEGNHTGYNLYVTKTIQGNLDLPRVQDTFQKIVSRHETLRTSFMLLEGKPVQLIHENPEFQLELFDGDCDKVEDCLNTFIRPFDLSQAPLIRCGIIKTGEAKQIMVVDAHHIVFDGISYANFFAEFSQLYMAEDLPLPNVQYKDYVMWSRRPDARKALEKQEAYWLDTLSGELPLLNLPLDFTRPAVQSFKGGSFDFHFEPNLSASIKSLTGTDGVTLFMVILSLFNLLLLKLSGQEDIIIAVPVGGRNNSDLEKLLGMFVNTVVMRNFPSEEQTFNQFLASVKTHSIKSFDNQEYPFANLVNHVVKERDLSRNPVFDVMLAYNPNYNESTNEKSSGEAELTLSNYFFEKTSSQFDLTLTAFERDQRLDFSIEYCSALFKEQSVRRFMDYFKTIAGAVSENPDIKIADIDILSAEEKEQLVHQFNDTSLDYPHDKTLHRLFEEQVARTPAQIAAFTMDSGSSKSGSTYEQLNQDANALAKRLRTQGSAPGNIVAIMVERNIHMITGLLAILKTGAAYLPMDPGYPQARVDYILDRSGASLLVTQSHLLQNDRSSSFHGGIIDIMDPTIYNKPVENRPGEAIASGQCAYVIYTSGSTGNPKGVMISHRSAVNFIAGMTRVIPFQPGRTILALTTISFDIFFLETILPLTTGMTAAVANEEQQRDPALLSAFISDNNVDMVQMTPSRLQLMIEIDSQLDGLAGVETLMIGGEAFPPQLHRALSQSFSGRIYNMYGPTETTIWSAVKDLTGVTPGQVTIGKPIANTQIYIVNSSFKLQPLGAAGELLIAGDGVAKGYLHNKALTSQKFINNPFSSGPGEQQVKKAPVAAQSLVYRTGDLARWLADGDIQFLGRLDQQVKIRGFRVELEEIEEQLLAYEPVKEAVVIARADSGANELCAYLVPHAKDAFKNGIDVTKIKEILSGSLPHYMIPAHFVPLEQLPLTPNGKIDRNALPRPDVTVGVRTSTFVAPQSGKEQQIAEIWKEVLNIDRVGVNDNFFDIGGNSLSVIQLGWKLGQKFGKEIPAAELFRNLTIEFLAKYFNSGPTDAQQELEKEKRRTQSLDKSKKTYKDSMNKLLSQRRRG